MNFETADLRPKRATSANSTFAIGGVFPMKNRDRLYSADSLVVAEIQVIRTNFCTEKPAHRQSAKRNR
jgi:hypothetical protein